MVITTFDIEAKNWIEVFLVGYYDGKFYYKFNSVDKFMKFLMKGKRKKAEYIYSHNGGNYDILFILEWLLNHKNIKFSLIGKENRIYELILNDYKIHFRDSFLIFNTTLKEVYKVFKTGVKIEVEDFNTISNEIYERNKEDCIGLYKAIKQFMNIMKVQKLNLTIAGLSFRKMKRSIGSENLYEVDDKTEEIFRKFYYGGRCEIFKFNQNYSYVFDVNSLYPYIMTTTEFPISKGFWIDNKVELSIDDYDRYGVFYFGIFEIPYMYIPPYPTQKNMYMTGAFEQLIEGIEAEKYIKVLYKRYIYEKGNYFRDYIKELYGKRKNAKYKYEKYIYKLMLNSIYGKFSEKRIQERIINDYIEGAKLFNFKFNLYSIEEEKRYIKNYIIYAKIITDKAREYMQYWYEKFQKYLIYTDTDSLHLSIYPDDIPISDKMGDFKLEREGKSIYLLPKLYQIGNKIKAKGFNLDIQKEKITDIKELYKGIDNIIFYKYRNVINSGKVQVIKNKKYIRFTYNKRKRLSNGDTEPYSTDLTIL